MVGIGLPPTAFGAVEDLDLLKRQAAMLTRASRRGGAEIRPPALELPVPDEIGVPVRGVIDLLDTDGRIIDLKTAAPPNWTDADYAF